MIKAKLIDPFNQSVIPALISRDYKDWKKLMNIKSPVDTVRLTDTINTTPTVLNGKKSLFT